MEDFLAFFDNTFKRVAFTSGICLIMVFIYQVFFEIIKSIYEKSTGREAKIVLPRLKGPLMMTFIIIGIFIGKNLLNYQHGMEYWLNRSLVILLILNISWILVKGVDIAKVIVLNRYKLESVNNLKARKIYTQFNVLQNIINVLIGLVAIATSMMTFDAIKELGTSLLASAGIAGIIIGFAAQRTIATVLAGFQIAITQPIRIDDVVIVEGEWGWIEEINLTYVVVRIWDLRRLVVPITYFIDSPFQNWTRNSADILGTVFLYTDYRVDFDALRNELTRLLESTDKWDGRVNVLQVTDSTEKSVQVRALMSAKNSPTAWDLRVYIREGLIKFLQENFPESLPHSRVYLEEDGIRKGKMKVNEASDNKSSLNLDPDSGEPKQK